MDQETYDAYVAILEEELVCAMGCTEPIAVAYCAALAREALGALPESAVVTASANIIKNVKSVVVPNTGGARGIEAAAAAGIVAGDACGGARGPRGCHARGRPGHARVSRRARGHGGAERAPVDL